MSVSGFILHCSVALIDSQYAAQAVASLAGKGGVYKHFFFTYILEKSNFAASRWSLLFSVLSVLMQHPVYVLQVMSSASPGDVRVERSLMCLGRKGLGGETQDKNQGSSNRLGNGFREVIFNPENQTGEEPLFLA